MEVIGVVALKSALAYGFLAFTYQTMQNAVGLFECSYMVSHDSEWGYKAHSFGQVKYILRRYLSQNHHMNEGVSELGNEPVGSF